MNTKETSSKDSNEKSSAKRAKIIYIDLDDVLADYFGATKCPITGKIREHMMWDKDFFLNLKPIPGSKGSVFELMKHGYDVWILSQPLADSPESYMDKAKWVQLHFPSLYKKLILTQDKGLHIGDYLIDDNEGKWKQKFEKNGGRFVHFPYGGYNPNPYPMDPEKQWRIISSFFLQQSPIVE